MTVLQLVFFIAALIILGQLRKQISQLFQGISLLIFNSYTPGVIFYSIFFLPGVIIHELSHLITAEILGVRTGRINIFPTEIKPGNVKMGSVESVQSDPLRETLIGIAPLILSIILIVLINNFIDFTYPRILLLYLVFTLANTMFTSKEDMRSFWFIPIPIIGIAAIIYVFKISLDIDKISQLVNKSLVSLNYALGLCLVLDLAFLFIMNFIKSFTQKITGKILVKKSTI